MSFQIETSTIPGAIGAGPPARKFVDYTHRLRFENAQTGDTAEALATVGEGPELADIATWADRAHGLDLLAVDEFDAKAEQKRRKAAAEDLSERMADASGEAARIVAAAHEEAGRIIQAARDQADDMIADAARELDAAQVKAEEAAAAAAAERDSGAGGKGKGK